MHTLVRSTLLAGLTGSLMVGAAWAGVGLSPVPVPTALPGQVSAPAMPAVPGLPGAAAPTAAAAGPAAAPAAVLGAGQLLVGASKTSLAPRPEDMKARFPTARWEQDAAKCKPLAPEYVTRLLTDTATEVDHLASAGSPWPENPSCLYMGGYGLGPMNPIVEFDEQLGLWVRALAIGDGKDLTVLTVIDGEGWLWDYKDKCEDCGTKQIADALAADPELAARGMKPESFNLHATHSHTSMDFLGGWGFVPDWYMAQATDTIKKTVREAVLAMQPALLETGVVDARQHNSERRGTYRSAEEAQLSWLRAVTTDKKKKARTIATMGAFAAHPVTQDADSGVAHADWPGYFAKRAE
jgi:hypothetical protein